MKNCATGAGAATPTGATGATGATPSASGATTERCDVLFEEASRRGCEPVVLQRRKSIRWRLGK